VLDILITEDVERYPAGIGNPAMSPGEILLKKEIVNRAGIWNVDVSPEVNVTYFCLAITVCLRPEPMRALVHSLPG
jgi:hypothetical protein